MTSGQFRGAPSRPGFWMNETTGVLRPAVEAFLFGEPMSGEDIAAMRAYLRQWIAGFPGLHELRAEIDGLTTRPALNAWLQKAVCAGIDPL